MNSSTLTLQQTSEQTPAQTSEQTPAQTSEQTMTPDQPPPLALRALTFRGWLRVMFQAHEYYQKRGDRYLVEEFARQAKARGLPVGSVSLARYLRAEQPVLPTPETCRRLAQVLGERPLDALLAAGYILLSDLAD